MIGFISSAKTFITLLSFFILLVELSLGQALPTRQINICPTRTIEKLLSFEVIRVSLLQGPNTGQDCSIFLPVQERSWIDIATTGYSVTKTVPSDSCNPAQQAYYVQVSHPDTSPRYSCGVNGNDESLFTLYSNAASEVRLQLVVKRLPYLGTDSYYQLRYNVARVVFHEKNDHTVEQVKQLDHIVSHSGYEYTQGQMYPADIDSTLTLGGFKLGSTVRLRIRDFDVDKADSDCNDYLKIDGLSYEMRSQIKICNDTTKLYNTAAISANVSFNFLTDGSNNKGRGFHIEYEITEEGCNPEAIEFADIEYDSNINGFVAMCKDGYWFDDTESGEKNVTCNLSNSTWSDTTPCSDINECLISKEGCSDVCYNTEGSYLCTCSDSSTTLHSDGLTCSSPKGKQSEAKSTIMYIAVGVAVPVVLIVLIIVIIVIVRRKRRNTESSKPGVARSISMKEVNDSDKDAINPQDTAEARKPPNATRTKGYGVVADENSMYQNNQELSGHHQPMPTQQREALDLVDNDLYGT